MQRVSYFVVGSIFLHILAGVGIILLLKSRPHFIQSGIQGLKIHLGKDGGHHPLPTISKTKRDTNKIMAPQTSQVVENESPLGSGRGEGGEGGEQGGLGGNDQVLGTIKRKIEAHKTYPLVAKKQFWQGISQVRFELHQNGSLKYVQLVQSSGHALLDEAALTAVKQAQPLPYYAGPIHFNLRFNLK